MLPSGTPYNNNKGDLATMCAFIDPSLPAARRGFWERALEQAMIDANPSQALSDANPNPNRSPSPSQAMIDDLAPVSASHGSSAPSTHFNPAIVAQHRAWLDAYLLHRKKEVAPTLPLPLTPTLPLRLPAPSQEGGAYPYPIPNPNP